MKKIIFSAAMLTTAYTMAQNTGIGTTAPTSTLHVKGSDAVSAQFETASVDVALRLIPQNNLNNRFAIRTLNNPNRTELIVFKDGVSNASYFDHATGNFGIGTADFRTKLAVAGDISYGTKFQNVITRTDAGLRGDAGARSGFFEADLLSDGSGGTNFPVGAKFYWHLLDIRHSNPNTNYAMQIAGEVYDQYMWFRKTNNNPSQSWSRVLSQNQETGQLSMLTNLPAGDGGNVLTVDSNGNVTKSPTSAISSSTEPWRIAGTNNPATANDQNIFQMGRVGIGTSTPISKLHLRYVQDPAITTEQGYANDIVFDNFEPNTNDGLSLVFRRFRGTEASPQNIEIGDRIGGFNFSGYMGGTIKSNGMVSVIHKGIVNNMQKSAMAFSVNDGQPSTPSLYLAETQNVGINTTAPSQQLDVNGNARVRQMPATNDEATYSRVVVADASGNLATISRTDPGVPNATETIFGNTSVSTDIMPTETFLDIQNNMGTRGTQYFRPSGRSITLPPGKWIVYCGYLLNPKPVASNPSGKPVLETGTSVWVRAVISGDNNPTLGIDQASTSLANGPSQISKSLTDNSLYEMANGVWLVDNTGAVDKTYYIKLSLQPYGFNTSNDKDLNNVSVWGEDYLFAIKRK